jgi:hypothetical protein
MPYAAYATAAVWPASESSPSVRLTACAEPITARPDSGITSQPIENGALTPGRYTKSMPRPVGLSHRMNDAASAMMPSKANLVLARMPSPLRPTRVRRSSYQPSRVVSAITPIGSRMDRPESRYRINVRHTVRPRTTALTSRPPMVGVPVFSMWVLGPSMRTFLPSPARRR